MMLRHAEQIQPFVMLTPPLPELQLSESDQIISPYVIGSGANNIVLPPLAGSPLHLQNMCSGFASHSSDRGLDKWN